MKKNNNMVVISLDGVEAKGSMMVVHDIIDLQVRQHKSRTTPRVSSLRSRSLDLLT